MGNANDTGTEQLTSIIKSLNIDTTKVNDIDSFINVILDAVDALPALSIAIPIIGEAIGVYKAASKASKIGARYLAKISIRNALSSFHITDDNIKTLIQKKAEFGLLKKRSKSKSKNRNRKRRRSSKSKKFKINRKS